MAPLYNSRGNWLATVQYNYLDSVTYNRLSYICTEMSGSIGQVPPQHSSVWVQMPQITQQDQIYLRSREDLLQYEDSRFQSLINAMANFYVTRNDQSVWGSFLRAVAMELARLEYMYSYDVVAKNPSFLTPPDIKRQYADPLFVTGTFQQATQFDAGDFGTNFGQWVTNTGVIFRAAITDSNNNIEICATTGTTGATEPQWTLSPSVSCISSSVAAAVGGNTTYAGYFAFGVDNALVGKATVVSGFTKSDNNGVFTVVASTLTSLTLNNPSGVAETNIGNITTGVTIDDEVVWVNAGSAPAALAYPVGYRDMLVDLLNAYQLGATPTSIQDVIYAYTGKNIIVEELYKLIVPGGFYDQSDRNAVKVSVNVGGTDPLTDIESLAELQQITNSLSGAIDLAKPAHVGLEFTTVFGADENIDCFISPRYLTQYQLDTLTESGQAYYVLIAYVLTQPIITGWTAETAITAGETIQDSNGNIQLAITSGITSIVEPTWNPAVQGITYDDAVTSPPSSPPTSPPSPAVGWVNVGTRRITISAYAALSTTQQAVYQGYYQNLNCTGSGIDDTLQIIIQQVEEPPFDPMLYQAPIFNVANPTTTLAAYGRHVLSPLSPTLWTTLTTITQVWNSGITYNEGDLVRIAAYPQANSWQMYRALEMNLDEDPTTAPEYWELLSSPSAYQAYYLSKGQYVLGIQQWSSTTAFYTGQFMIDNNGNLEIETAASSVSPPVQPVTAPIATIDTTQQHEVVISGNSLTIKVVSTAGMGLQTADTQNPSLLSLLGFTYATFLNGLTLPVTGFTPTTITMSYTHDDYDSGGQAEVNGKAQTGFNTTTNGLTYDGSAIWQNLGLNYLNTPSKWILVVDSNNAVTGEVANWSIKYPMGLLAPRQDLVWEIGGNDTFSSYEME